MKWILLLFTLFLTLSLVSGQDSDNPEDVLFLDMDQVYGVSKFTQPIASAPASITIITAAEIRTRGYRHLGQALNSVPGIYYSTHQPEGRVGIRGAPALGNFMQHILVLVDGIPVNDAVIGGVHLREGFLVPIQVMERIEVIKGPGSTLYGTNAFLAVVNIITKQGRDLQGQRLNAHLGSHRRAGLTYQAGYRWAADREWLVALDWFEEEGEDLFFNQFATPENNNGFSVDQSDRRSGALFFKLRLQRWHLSMGYREMEQDITAIPNLTVFNNETNDQEREKSFIQIAYDHHHLGGELKGRIFALHADEELTYRQVPQPLLPVETTNVTGFHGTRLGLELQYQRRLSEHFQLLAGFETHWNRDLHQENTIVDMFTLFTLEKNLRNNGFFLQVEWQKGPWILDLGGRHDHYHGFEDHFSPRGALIYRHGENNAVKLLFAKAFRSPNALETFFETPAGLITNPNLSAEETQTVELIIEQRLAPRTKARLALFTNNHDGLIGLFFDPERMVFQQRNNLDYQVQGIETAFSYTWDSGSIDTGYTWQTHEQETNPGPLFNSPRHLSKLAFQQRIFDDRLSLTSQWQHIGSRHTRSGERLGSTLLGRIHGSWRLGEPCRLILSVDNLLDRRYSQPTTTGVAQQALQQEGRNARLAFEIEF